MTSDFDGVRNESYVVCVICPNITTNILPLITNVPWTYYCKISRSSSVANSEHCDIITSGIGLIGLHNATIMFNAIKKYLNEPGNHNRGSVSIYNCNDSGDMLSHMRNYFSNI